LKAPSEAKSAVVKGFELLELGDRAVRLARMVQARDVEAELPRCAEDHLLSALDTTGTTHLEVLRLIPMDMHLHIPPKYIHQRLQHRVLRIIRLERPRHTPRNLRRSECTRFGVVFPEDGSLAQSGIGVHPTFRVLPDRHLQVSLALIVMADQVPRQD